MSGMSTMGAARQNQTPTLARTLTHTARIHACSRKAPAAAFLSEYMPSTLICTYSHTSAHVTDHYAPHTHPHTLTHHPLYPLPAIPQTPPTTSSMAFGLWRGAAAPQLVKPLGGWRRGLWPRTCCDR